MRWDNGRFVKRPIFPFYAHNIYTRQQIRSKSTFVNRTRNDPTAQWGLDDIRRAFAENTEEFTRLRELIIRTSSILGTKVYWYTRRTEMQSMRKSIGCPDFFITLSAADYHWHSLMRLTPLYS